MPRSAAGDIKPLFGIGALIAIAVVFVVILFLLFPGHRPRTLPELGEAAGDSIEHLDALLQARPEDVAARLALTRKLLKIGDYERAETTLKPMLTEQPDREALRAETEIALARLAAAPADAASRPALRSAVESDLSRLEAAPDLTPDDLAWLAERRLELEQPAQAAALYERLAKARPEDAYESNTQAGRWWLAANQPAKARTAYQAAFAAATTAEQKHDAAYAALAAARATPGAGSLAVAKQMVAAQGGDPAVLDQAIAIALDNGNAGQAYEWSEKRVALTPDDGAALRRHADLALAIARPGLAREAYQRYLARHPEDGTALAELARLDEWSGHQAAALADWRELGRRSPSATTDAKIMKLALAQNDAQAQVEVLRREQSRRRFSAVEMTRYVDLLDRELGDPQAAIRVLNGWLQRDAACKPLWQRLAQLYDQTDQPEKSLKVWEGVALAYGRDLTETQARARLQLRQWHFGAALATLLSLPASASTDAAYWNRIGELAWLRNDMPNTLRGYGWLFDHQSTALDDEGAQRLVLAAVRERDVARATEVAVVSWPRLHDPQLILDALDGAEQQGRDDLAARLYAVADGEPSAFAGMPAYWRLRGDSLQRHGDASGALLAYERVLALTPDDPAIQAAVLYVLIEQGARDRLRRRLEAWRGQLEGNPQLWQPYAIGYAQLGRFDLALPWFSRYSIEHPSDYLWLLAYADALDSARRFESGQRIRQYALTRLRPQVLARGARPLSEDERERDARTLAAQQNLVGAQQDYAWLHRVLMAADRRRLDGRDLELLMDWHASRDQPDYARFWLLRAQMRRLRAAPYLRLSVALERDDHREVARILDFSAAEGISDRVEARRRIGQGDESLVLALDHINDREPWATGVELLQRYAAEQYQQMPQHATLAVEGVNLGGLKLASELASFKRSSKRWTLAANAGTAQLAGGGLQLKLDGFSHEIRGGVEVTRRGGRGVTTVGVERVETDYKGFTQFSLLQTLRITERLTGRVFGHWREQSLESAALRAFGTRDSGGAGFSYRFTQRDSFDLEAQTQRYRSRIDDAALGHGYQLNAEFTRALMVGRNYEFAGRIEASLMRNHPVAALPASLVPRLPAGYRSSDLVPSEFGLAGIGLSFSHGEPGSDYPLVGELRYLADVSLGYVWPRRGLGASVSFGIGSRVLGSDELSLHLGVDGTGAASTSISRSVGLQYRYFFGR